MRTFRISTLVFLCALATPAPAMPQGIAASHIEANVPVGPDFRNFLVRDLQAYFAASTGKRVRAEYELLRDGPTQSGVAYPKYYAWVRVFAGQTLLDEGAVRVAAIERVRFEVTHFLSKARIARDPQALESIVPKLLLPAIRERAGLAQ